MDKLFAIVVVDWNWAYQPLNLQILNQIVFLWNSRKTESLASFEKKGFAANASPQKLTHVIFKLHFELDVKRSLLHFDLLSSAQTRGLLV